MAAIHKDLNELPLSGREKIMMQAPYRVLVVDDMETNRQLIINSLQPSRYIVAEAVDGKGALDMLARQQFDVVVLEDRKSTRLNSSHSQISDAVLFFQK